MNRTILKRGITLLLSLLFIFTCFTACAGAPDTPHPVLNFKGENFYYGMEIDTDELLEKFPNTQVSNNSYSINPFVSLVIRETEGKKIVVGYFLTGYSEATIKGFRIGDSEKKYLSNFENSGAYSSDPKTGTKVLGFFYYKDKFVPHSKYQQYMTAARFEGTEAYEEFLNTVCVSTAMSNGTMITNMCYGDYNAIYNGK